MGCRPGYQDCEESDPGASSRQEPGGHLGDVGARRKSRDAADDDAEEEQDEECDDEDRDIHDGARQASGLNLVDARSLRSVPPRLGGTPTASTRRLDHDEVVASKLERHFRRKDPLTLAPPEEVPTWSTVLPAGKAFRPQGAPLGKNGGGPGLAKKSEGPPDPVPARESTSPAAVRDESVLLDAERCGQLEGFDRGVARVRHVGVHAGHPPPIWECPFPARERLVVGEGPWTGGPERQVVHRPLALRGHAIPEGNGEREEQDVDD